MGRDRATWSCHPLPPCPPSAPSSLTSLSGGGRWQSGQPEPAGALAPGSVHARRELREGGTGSLGEAGTPGYVSHWMDKLLGKACFLLPEVRMPETSQDSPQV